MIRFACPTCQKVLKTPEHGAGRKITCPKCGQRLLIPQPEKPAATNPTLLGELTSPSLLVSTPPASTESDSLSLLGLRRDAELEGKASDQLNFKPTRSWPEILFAALALALTIAAFLVGVVHHLLLGAGLAGLGVLLSVLSLFVVVRRRRTGWGLPLVNTVACSSIFLLTIVLLARNAESEERWTQADMAKQDQKKTSLTNEESKQPENADSRAEQNRPIGERGQKASRRTQRHEEEEEKSKPKDDGRPRFDPDDLQRTAQWGQAILERLQQDTKNGIRYRATLEKLREEIRVHEGVKVRWVFQVGSIGEDRVVLLDQTRYSNPIHSRFGSVSISEGDDSNSFYFNNLSLKVGRGISKEKAAKLNPGDKITVRAKVSTITLVTQGLPNFSIVLNDLRGD